MAGDSLPIGDDDIVADAFVAYTVLFNGYRVKWQMNVKNLFGKLTTRPAVTTYVWQWVNHVRCCCVPA
ncbi:MAG: hypothetical protein ACSLEN_12005 [Candidatus Malihini olakiniferum]